MMKNRSKSRKRTPWDNQSKITPTQEYLQMHFAIVYKITSNAYYRIVSGIGNVRNQYYI